MKIVPVDIANKSFSKKLMGFDENEVINYLNAVANEMDNLLREKNALKEMLREKELQMLEYKDRDKVLKETITTAHNMSEKIIKDAEREAKLILNDAHQKSELVGADSRDQLKSIYKEISDLRRTKIQFEAGLRAMIRSHLDMIEHRENFLDADLLNKVEKPLDNF